MNTWS